MRPFLLLLLLPGAPAKPEPEPAPRERPTVPVHPLSILDDCPDDQLRFAIGSIAQAIEVGAPLYNAGDHAGCYRHYLGTATDVVTKLPNCGGVRGALTTGIAQAAAIPDYTAEAWVMRDTFDGLIDVYGRKVGATKPAKGKSVP